MLRATEFDVFVNGIGVEAHVGADIVAIDAVIGARILIAVAEWRVDKINFGESAEVGAVGIQGRGGRGFDFDAHEVGLRTQTRQIQAHARNLTCGEALAAEFGGGPEKLRLADTVGGTEWVILRCRRSPQDAVCNMNRSSHW